MFSKKSVGMIAQTETDKTIYFWSNKIWRSDFIRYNKCTKDIIQPLLNLLNDNASLMIKYYQMVKNIHIACTAVAFSIAEIDKGLSHSPQCMLVCTLSLLRLEIRTNVTRYNFTQAI